MRKEITCFKAYDVRGRVPDELDEDVCERIGRAYVQFLGAQKVVVGRDIRESSEFLKNALCRGLNAAGADVIDIGLCGTEEVYFATSHLKTGGGIMITVSVANSALRGDGQLIQAATLALPAVVAQVDYFVIPIAGARDRSDAAEGVVNS